MVVLQVSVARHGYLEILICPDTRPSATFFPDARANAFERKDMRVRSTTYVTASSGEKTLREKTFSLFLLHVVYIDWNADDFAATFYSDTCPKIFH